MIKLVFSILLMPVIDHHVNFVSK